MPRKHVLKFLIEKCKAYTLELAKVFPLDTEEEKHLFELLERSYIEARYNKDYKITSEQLEYLIARVEILKDMTERLCKEKIAEYNAMAENG